jgi:hypothetical protein
MLGIDLGLEIDKLMADPLRRRRADDPAGARDGPVPEGAGGTRAA